MKTAVSSYTDATISYQSQSSCVGNVICSRTCVKRLRSKRPKIGFKETRSVTMIIFRKKYFLFKSFVKIELSYVFTIDMFSTAESCMEQ